MGYDILEQFLGKIIESLVAEHSIEFPSGLVGELLEQDGIDVGRHVVIP